MLDDKIQTKLFRNTDSGQDIIGTVAMDAAAHLTTDNGNQRIQLEIVLEGLSLGLGSCQLFGILLGIKEGLAQNSACTHAGHGHTLLAAIIALGVFAQCHLHDLCAGNDLLQNRVGILQLNGDTGTTDDIGRTGQAAHDGKAALARFGDTKAPGIERVDHADMGGNRIGGFIIIVAAALGTGFTHGQMAVGIDEAGCDPLALEVDDLCIFGNFCILLNSLDDAVFDQNGRFIDNTVTDGDSFTVFQCKHCHIPLICPVHQRQTDHRS